MGFSFRGSYTFIQAEKMKMMKFNLKSWNKEIFGNVAIRKNLALLKCSRILNREWELYLERRWLLERNQGSNFINEHLWKK